MTESEWLGCADPTPLLEFLRGKASERKLRLFACACCRRVSHLMSDSRAFHAMDVAERAAEGGVSEEETEPARLANFDLYYEVKPDGTWDNRAGYAQAAHLAQAVNHAWSSGAADWAASFASHGLAYEAGRYETTAWTAAQRAESAAQSTLLRDVFGNPSLPVSVHPVQLTPTVLSLAQAAYEERIMPSDELDPARLAVLSDALEEAGCDDADILNHLRSSEPHVRGCWAVDLLLGKE